MSIGLNFARSGERLTQILIQEGIKNQQVLEAVSRVPRHAFIQPALAHKAYENTALPIGKGQTISQPAIVARMTEIVLDHHPELSNVLEIGTGCGYQTAVLAQLVDKVFSVERISSLQFQARRVLRQLDLHNISLKHGDGWKGWASKAPFDAIIVTAAAASVPQKLLAQIADNGIMVIPVGVEDQVLKVIKRSGDDFQISDVANVKFVPLVAGDIE
ncbi:protein-L-isoaspartate(D-aspartate) O-methyltransferase [Catenovulum maritimum]|uniref:Protein-L-isoaspartate O-methyltransferase n=1 Tax=Catenovulum maritimum TaxID=1513271 RepID=A0A0J8JLF2_9ALTE|nr:protein-L-isoaspartate(D-aspartate) O-methyltransferase [Catenovulum maritimum]KMT65391.1 protein-L-isoaspartate O-methyltransferase [Catenovulum maritimum]